MLTLIVLYKWTILAGMVAAPALALLGAQLANRDRAMQTLCVGQGAMVGVLLGIGTLHTLDLMSLETFGPLASALAVSALTFLVTDRLVLGKVASKNTIFTFIFALLLAVGYLASSLFPALESHMAQVYFGDLATLTPFDSKITLALSSVCLLFLTYKSAIVSNQSFELAVFGGYVSTKSRRSAHLAFKLVTLLLLCLSVQFIGFLFTVAMLFLPTGILNFFVGKGLRRHLWLSAVLSSLATISGFLLSLNYTRLPTVPAIVAVLFVFGVSVLGVEAAWLLVSRVRVNFPRPAESAGVIVE